MLSQQLAPLKILSILLVSVIDLCSSDFIIFFLLSLFLLTDIQFTDNQLQFLFIKTSYHLRKIQTLNLSSHIISCSGRELRTQRLASLFTIPCFASFVKSLEPRLSKTVVLSALSFHLTLGWKRFTRASIVGYNCLAKSLSWVN